VCHELHTRFIFFLFFFFSLFSKQQHYKNNIIMNRIVSRIVRSTVRVNSATPFLKRFNATLIPENVTVMDRLSVWSNDKLKIDGETALHAVIDTFYVNVVKDPELSRYFEGADMLKLKKHQVLTKIYF
jgi:hypothetical protein